MVNRGTPRRGDTMGLFDIFKARKREPTETDAGYTAASIRYGEEHAAQSASAVNQVDFNRVARGVAGSIYNAASIIATECASQPLRLYRRAGRGRLVKSARDVSPRTADFLRGKTAGMRPTAKAANMAESAERIEEVIDHPALQLLADPDPVTTASDFLTMLYWYRETAGKCYVWTGEQTRDGPAGLYILHPQFTQPILSRETFIEGYRYGRETSGIITVPADQVIFSPYQRDPFRPWDGVSWLSSVEQYADAENAALVTEVQRWKNAGQPGFILSVPSTYTDAQMKQAEAALRAKSGPFAAGRALIIRDAEMVQASAKAHEMGYITGIEQAEKAIYRAAGIPEAIWKLNDANLAGAKIGERLLMRSCYKRMRRVAEDLTVFLLPMFGEQPGDMWFGYENPDIEDQQVEAQIMNAAYTAGVVSEDEYRRVLYLPPRTRAQSDSVDVAESELATGAASDSVDVEESELPAAQTETESESVDVAESELAEPANDAAPESGDGEPMTAAPAVDATIAAAAGGVDVAATALNGAQVEALAGLATSVANGELPMQSARAIAGAAFPTVDAAVLDAVFDPLDRFTPEVAANETTKSGARVRWQRSCGTGIGMHKTDSCGGSEYENKALPDLTPPAAVRDAAAQGLAWREEYGRGGTAVGVARARDLMNGRTLSADTIGRMVSYFARHEIDKQAEGFNDGEPGFPSAGRIAWELWGGDAGRDWSNEMAAAIEQAESETDSVGKIKPPGKLTAEELAELARLLRPLMRDGMTDANENETKSVTVPRWEWDGPACGCVTKADIDNTDDAVAARIRDAIKTWVETSLADQVRNIGADMVLTIDDLSRQQLGQAMRVGIEAAFNRGATEALQSMRITDVAPLQSDAARQYVEQYNFRLVRDVTDTMKNQLQTEISRGIEAGETRAEIQARLLERVDNMSETRANLIANTETPRAYQHGAIKQSEEVGITGKAWNLSGNPCGLCEGANNALAGKTVPIGQPFFAAGDVIMGTDGKSYVMGMNVNVAAEIHPRCRCGTVRIDEE